MEAIPRSYSLLSYLDHLEYSEAALSAHPDTAPLAALFAEEIAAWPGMFGRERGARRSVTRGNAVLAVRNADLDEATTRFGGEVLVEAGQDRSSPFFRRFFPVAPSVLVRQALRKQCDRTLNVIVVEIEKLDEQNRLRPFATLLADLAKAALGALDGRGRVQGERSTVRSDIDEWKEGVNQLRLTTYAELLKMAAASKRRRTWADTFFAAVADDAGQEPAPVVPAPEPEETP
ncbi:MAG: hypothetical protein HYV63_08010 [Candidatus Schekmanbacteria bacterium]|nr:hypothetical protein [Candidatus Schekmanbacteria bacterium]